MSQRDAKWQKQQQFRLFSISLFYKCLWVIVVISPDSNAAKRVMDRVSINPSIMLVMSVNAAPVWNFISFDNSTNSRFYGRSLKLWNIKSTSDLCLLNSAVWICSVEWGVIYTGDSKGIPTSCVIRNNRRISGVILLSAVVYQRAFWSHSVLPICRKCVINNFKLLRVANNFHLNLQAVAFHNRLMTSSWLRFVAICGFQ